MPTQQRHSHSNTSQSILPLVLIGIAMAVFSAFAMSMMGHPFELDESCSILKAQLSFGALITYLKTDGHTPLYYLLLKAWLWLFGVSELSARMFSLVGQLGAAALLFLYGQKVLRSSWAGAFSGIVFLIGTNAMKTAIFVKMYPLMALLTVLSILLTQQAVATGEKRYLVLTSLTVCVASFTNSLIFYSVIGLITACVIHGKNNWLKIMTSCLAGLVPYAVIWLPIAMGQAQNASIDWIRKSSPMAPVWDIYYLFSPVTLLLPLTALIAADFGSLKPWRKLTTLGRTVIESIRDKRILFPALVFATSYGAFCATSFLAKPLLGIPRYEIIFLPMLSIPMGAFLGRIGNFRITALMLTGLMIACLVPYPTNVRYPSLWFSKKDVLYVASNIADRLQPDDVIVTIGQSYLPLKLYLNMQSAPPHIQLAIPRDVEIHPGWNRYQSRGHEPDDLPMQWESIYETIQRKAPGHVYVISGRNRTINKWFLGRFSEHMTLAEHMDIDARSWFITGCDVFTPSSSKTSTNLKISSNADY